MSLFPKNRWMNDVNFLAAMAHFAWAALIVVSSFLLRRSWPETEWWTGALVAFAAVKEFFYDARYELPKQTVWDNVSDFLEYCAGCGAGWGVLWLARHLHPGG